MSVCSFVCLSARISQNHTFKFHVMCTSGFVDDVMFLHNGANRPESKTARMFRQMAALVGRQSDNVVWSSLPHGGTGDEVCCNSLILVPGSRRKKGSDARRPFRSSCGRRKTRPVGH